MVGRSSVTYWINRFKDQWDIYVKDYGLNIEFRKPIEESQFNKTISINKLYINECLNLQYMPTKIVASLFYLIILQLNVYVQDTLEIMLQISMLKDNQFNIIFGQFIQAICGLALQGIPLAIQYFVGCYDLKINYETPPGVVHFSNTPLESNYEEFLSFLCYQKSLLEFIRQKSRD